MMPAHERANVSDEYGDVYPVSNGEGHGA